MLILTWTLLSHRCSRVDGALNANLPGGIGASEGQAVPIPPPGPAPATTQSTSTASSTETITTETSTTEAAVTTQATGTSFTECNPALIKYVTMSQ